MVLRDDDGATHLMANVVWKFPLEIGRTRSGVGWEPKFAIEMPWKSKPISVGVIGDSMSVWVIADPKAPVTKHWFAVVATGAESSVPGFATFVGTIIVADRGIVLHVFDLGDEAPKRSGTGGTHA
jgi:hypothetical protein